MVSQSRIPQHKRMATGERVGFKSGGSVNFSPTPKATEKVPPKSGFRDTPIEKVKRANGVKGV